MADAIGSLMQRREQDSGPGKPKVDPFTALAKALLPGLSDEEIRRQMGPFG